MSDLKSGEAIVCLHFDSLTSSYRLVATLKLSLVDVPVMTSRPLSFAAPVYRDHISVKSFCPLLPDDKKA